MDLAFSPMMQIVLPLAMGLALGIFYFGGLWLTLRRLAAARQPALLVLGSYLLRLAVSLAGFVLAARLGSWPGLLVCTAAFISVRIVMTQRLGSPAAGLGGDAP